MSAVLKYKLINFAGTCKNPGPVANAHQEMVDDYLEVGQMFLDYCLEPYTRESGQEERTCLANGVVTGKPLVCKRLYISY